MMVRLLLAVVAGVAVLALALVTVGTPDTAQAAAALAETYDVTSPDGRTTVTVDVGRQLAYAVRYDGRPIVEPSRLGVVLAGSDTLGIEMEVLDTERATHDETWTQPWGEVAEVRDHHNALTLQLAETAGERRRMNVEIRVFDGGIGVRYVWPEQDGLGTFEIMDELTEFRIADDPTTWFIRAYEENRYEYLYERMPLSRTGHVLHTPVTMGYGDVDGDASGPYVAVHEAALVDYAAMSLRRVGPTAFQADLAPWSTGVRVYAEAPHRSPWRVLLIGDEPGDLVTNYTVLNLNEPNALGDVSWAEPGKYIGIWWSLHLGEETWGSGDRHGATTENTRRYIDFAAEHGFSGVLVEGWNTGWDGNWIENGNLFSFTNPYPDYDFEALAGYARQRGTRLIGHHETSGNVPNYERQLASALDLMAERGVRAIKTGYVNFGMNYPRTTGPGVAPGDTVMEYNTGQFMVRHLQHTVEEAARRQISLNIHEPVKATGLRRTYPNLMTREGARGQEYNAWSEGNGPGHVPTLVFTRMLSGPMDFTPGIFDIDAVRDDGRQINVPTTLAGQLALYVVLYSPLQMAADLPENYEPHMDAFQFIKDVPADWADTRVLEARIGRFVTIARQDRASDDWYLGAKTDGQSRTMDIALDFLDAGRTYTATLYRDADDAHWETNATVYAIETREVTAADRLAVPLAPGGGLAVRFEAQ
ncbi:MAG: glycoside hydrolase family 97 protein [Bacteroidota bacterium]